MNDVPATSVPTAAMAARELRRMRARRLAIAFAIWVAVPTLLAVVYYGAIATPEYESVAVLTVHAPTPLDAPGDRRGAKAAGVLGPELDALREHLLSRPTMDAVAREAGLLRHGRGGDVDFLSRLAAGAGAETAHDYYRRKVSAVIDARGATLALGVRAFSATKAQQAARALVLMGVFRLLVAVVREHAQL
jgi:capsular polysaccharide transport system permease protein